MYLNKQESFSYTLNELRAICAANQLRVINQRLFEAAQKGIPQIDFTWYLFPSVEDSLRQRGFYVVRNETYTTISYI
jgi:hypothetical protein